MPRRNRPRGRPQAVKRVRLDVVRRPEDQIDRRQLALALIALQRSLRDDSAAPTLQQTEPAADHEERPSR